MRFKAAVPPAVAASMRLSAGIRDCDPRYASVPGPATVTQPIWVWTPLSARTAALAKDDTTRMMISILCKCPFKLVRAGSFGA